MATVPPPIARDNERIKVESYSDDIVARIKRLDRRLKPLETTSSTSICSSSACGSMIIRLGAHKSLMSLNLEESTPLDSSFLDQFRVSLMLIESDLDLIGPGKRWRGARDREIRQVKAREAREDLREAFDKFEKRWDGQRKEDRYRKIAHRLLEDQTVTFATMTAMSQSLARSQQGIGERVGSGKTYPDPPGMWVLSDRINVPSAEERRAMSPKELHRLGDNIEKELENAMQKETEFQREMEARRVSQSEEFVVAEGVVESLKGRAKRESGVETGGCGGEIQ
ncbi:hypothetical protein L202_02930 [Cryptococcus amylolentus CBS 6039]|uniref:Uncharacterized protein n=1 Tax=Cryptococcus amylolentus CBS 6039 TaxID=1295533 RepID=A0A1E3HWW4_9TREE|nr:hypothetical protein L202_02930 [Cryptococcus amylolentus CBS 6039]ODN80779.1 hypothetical protein L202_02930 [Cryptococcus amylolentus CBS 6039]